MAFVRIPPPNSSEFKPIEQVLAKLKALVRGARPRTFDHVVECVAAALGRFALQE